MQCLKRSKSKPDKGLVIAIAPLVRNAGIAHEISLRRRKLNITLYYMTDQPNPSNEIHRVGFPEGQLLGNGASEKECAEISAAYLLGKPLPKSDNEVINRINDRLTQTSGYGLYSDWGEE